MLHLFNTLGLGGMERQIVQLVRLLRAQSDFEVSVAAQAVAGPLAAELAGIGFTEIPAFPLRRLYGPGAARQMHRFAAHLRRMRIDLLHTHDFYTTTFGIPAAVLARVPVRIAARRELAAFTPGQRRVERLVTRAADVIVANCDALRGAVIREGADPERVVTIPNGVDPARVALPADPSLVSFAAELGVPPGGRLVTMVAHLYNRQKDFESFIAAAARIAPRFPEVLFLCAGGGGPEDRRRAISLAAGAGIEDRVLFPGRCDRIAELLALSEIGVLSSRSEGLSNTVLEYMAAGLPVVATDVGGTAEAVLEGETGYLVPPGSPALLAERLATLLADPARACRMGEAGRERAHRRFSLDALLERSVDLYDRLLVGGASGRTR